MFTRSELPSQVVVLPRHSGDDVADTGTCVHPATQQPQLRLARRQEREPDGGAEEAGAVIEHVESVIRLGDELSHAAASGIEVALNAPSLRGKPNAIRRNRRSHAFGSRMRTRRRRYSRRTRSDVHVLSLAPTPRAPARAGDPPHLDEPTTRTRYRRLVVLRSSSRRRSCSWPAGLRSSFAPRADATNPASSSNQMAVVVRETKGFDMAQAWAQPAHAAARDAALYVV